MSTSIRMHTYLTSHILGGSVSWFKFKTQMCDVHVSEKLFWFIFFHVAFHDSRLKDRQAAQRVYSSEWQQEISVWTFMNFSSLKIL